MADDISELIAYYSPGAPDPILFRACSGILGRAKPESRKKAIDWIVENIPRQDGKFPHKLSVTDIKQALAEVGEPANEYIYTEKWTCDLCGMQFQYAQVVEYSDKHDKGIFDYCPRCGLQVCDTIQAKKEAALQRGEYRAWYQRRKDSVKESWRVRGGWMFDKAKDDAFTEAQHREEVERMKAAAQKELADLKAVKPAS